MTRTPTDSEFSHIEEVLCRLREHFAEWPTERGQEHELIGFAFYEGCGGTNHCGDTIAEAASLAVGQELVTQHGFEWVMIENEGMARYGVFHELFGEPIDLAKLENGDWNFDAPDEPPVPGETTHDSQKHIVDELRKRRLGNLRQNRR